MLGHIIIGVQMIEDRARNIPDFPEQLLVMLKHLLLSHHGQYEFGSPKRPKFLEAVVLSFIDDLDSKINGIQTHIDKEPNRDGNWTNYHRLYDRYFYKGQLAEAAAVEPVTATVTETETVLRNKPLKTKKKRYDKPLGATVAEQLKEKNLDLFSAITEKGKNS